MTGTDEQRNKQRAIELHELAINGLITNFGLDRAEANRMFFIECAKILGPKATKAALKEAGLI